MLILIILLIIQKPSGLLHIDEYTNKDIYRMLYFVPVEDLKKHRKLTLKVEVQKWTSESPDTYFEEDY